MYSRSWACAFPGDGRCKSDCTKGSRSFPREVSYEGPSQGAAWEMKQDGRRTTAWVNTMMALTSRDTKWWLGALQLGHLWPPRQGLVELRMLWQSERWCAPDGPHKGQKIIASLQWGYQGWAQCSDETELRSICERFENILGVIWMSCCKGESEDKIDA